MSVPCWSNSYIMLERCNFHEWIVASSWRLGFFVKSSWLWNNWVAVFSAQKQLHCNWRCYKSKEQVTKVGGIGAGVKVVDSHLCGWGSIPSKICIFLRVSLSKSLSLCFMCSDQHVKYRMPRGFPSTSSLLLAIWQMSGRSHGLKANALSSYFTGSGFSSCKGDCWQQEERPAVTPPVL